MTYSNRNPGYYAQSRQDGFSLIELMVAVLIGLFITLGLTQIFVSMYSTSQSQSSLLQFQSNERQSILALTNVVQLAGYYAATPTALTDVNTFLPAATAADGATFVAGAGIVGTTGTGTPQQDTIDIYYQSSGVDNVFDCQGANTQVGTPTAPDYTTVINSYSVNASYQLICSTKKTFNGATTTTTALVLANNVKNMTILYGVDSTAGTATPLNTTNSYMTATQVSAANFWPNIRAVQITLNFCTSNVFISNPTTCTATTPWVQTINLMGKA